jgi:hypothetical protein
MSSYFRKGSDCLVAYRFLAGQPEPVFINGQFAVVFDVEKEPGHGMRHPRYDKTGAHSFGSGALRVLKC